MGNDRRLNTGKNLPVFTALTKGKLMILKQCTYPMMHSRRARWDCDPLLWSLLKLCTPCRSPVLIIAIRVITKQLTPDLHQVGEWWCVSRLEKHSQCWKPSIPCFPASHRWQILSILPTDIVNTVVLLGILSGGSSLVFLLCSWSSITRQGQNFTHSASPCLESIWLSLILQSDRRQQPPYNLGFNM